MDYYALSSRLIGIKKDIQKLKNVKFEGIPHRLKVLRQINVLLEERNQLLLIKQEMICNDREFLITVRRSDANMESLFKRINNKVASKRIKRHQKTEKSAISGG
jgi:hypothetical protein